MFKFLVVVLAMCSFLTFASEDKSLVFNFNGTDSDTQLLSTIISVTKYKDEQYQGTCYNQIPYQEEECGYETRYREECRWVPGENQCRTVYDRQCRLETKYRRECTRGPSRNTCRQVTKYRKECRTGPSRQKCHMEPGREICKTNANGKRVCRQRPGRQVCKTVPGRQTCNRVPYTERECKTEPGRKVCRDVPYNDRVCRQVARQACEWIPGRNMCRQEPYQEYICKMVTKYRSEPYECTKTRKVAYQEDQEVKHKVNVNYIGAIDKANATFTLAFDQDAMSFLTSVENLNKEQTQVNYQVDGFTRNSNYNYESNLNVEFFDLDEAKAPLQITPVKVKLNREGMINLESTPFEGVDTARAEITVFDLDKKKLHFKKTMDLMQFDKTQLESGNIVLTGDLAKKGFEKISKNLFRKNKNIKVTITIFPKKSKVPGQDLKPVTHTLETKIKI